jgi:hypothetical protein
LKDELKLTQDKYGRYIDTIANHTEKTQLMVHRNRVSILIDGVEEDGEPQPTATGGTIVTDVYYLLLPSSPLEIQAE